MQKNVLLLFMIMNCSMMYAGDYIDELIAQYNEAIKLGSIDQVYNDQKAANEKRRTEDRSHQCNGRHFSQPDENSVTGREHVKIETEYSNRSKTNDELHDGYKNNFNLDWELKRKIFIMAELYLSGLNKCGKDNSCLQRNDCITWEEMSAPGSIDQRCSTVYDSVSYQEKIVLTKEQKIEIAQNDPQIKELVTKLNEVNQKLQDKINILNK